MLQPANDYAWGVLNWLAKSYIISSFNGAASKICCSSFSVNNLEAKALASSSFPDLFLCLQHSPKNVFLPCKMMCSFMKNKPKMVVGFKPSWKLNDTCYETILLFAYGCFRQIWRNTTATPHFAQNVYQLIWELSGIKTPVPLLFLPMRLWISFYQTCNFNFFGLNFTFA